MPFHKKTSKKNITLETANKKGIKMWFWLMIIGPAIFLLLYWIYSRPETIAHNTKQPIPGSFLTIGQEASVDGKSFVVGPDKKVFFTQTLQLRNNSVAADPGHTFLVVPVLLSQSAAQNQKDLWWALDGEGTSYPLLKTTAYNPVNINYNEENSPAKGFANVYQIYKIAKENTSFYIVFDQSKHNIAWKVK